MHAQQLRLMTWASVCGCPYLSAMPYRARLRRYSLPEEHMSTLRKQMNEALPSKSSFHSHKLSAAVAISTDTPVEKFPSARSIGFLGRQRATICGVSRRAAQALYEEARCRLHVQLLFLSCAAE